MIVRWREFIGACAMLAFVTFGFYLTTQIDLSFSSDLETFTGPRAYPRIILGVMLGLTIILIARGWAARNWLSQDQDAERTSRPYHPRLTKVAMAIVLIVVATYFFDPIGYLIVVPPLVFIAGLLNGARNHLTNAIASVAVSAACLILFRYGVNIVLPEGILGIDQIF